jgi:transposase-like protein
MIAMACHRCGSTDLRKNGRTRTGQQKFHCKACNLYGTLDRKDHERAIRRATAEQLHLERLSQRAIARTLGMGRSTVARIVQKKS